LLEALCAGLIGLLIGSFLNVCIYRLPRDLSVVRPRSFCPACEQQIAWFDNIPVVTYIVLGGKCRHCAAPISFRYPLVEALTGVLFFAAAYPDGFTLATLKVCIFVAIQIALIFADFEARILPDEFTLGGVVAGIILAAVIPMPPTLMGFFVPYAWGPRVVSVAEAAFGAAVYQLLSLEFRRHLCEGAAPRGSRPG
jgi:leader peptidase (prepilin peptidase)/N-methyltransferase